MVTSSLLIPYGMDSAGKMVDVNLVPRGKACGLVCPSCNTPLVARKGSIRQNHLAHSPGTPTCEGWLHATAKMILYQRIQDAIAANSVLPIRWSHVCPNSENLDTSLEETAHEQNILHKGILDDVASERHLSNWNIRPDIVCFSAEKPRVLIEVVDTHPPEKQIIDTGLPVLEIHVDGSTDLRTLSTGLVPVAEVHNYPCPDPICAKCYNRKSYGCNHCKHCGQHVSKDHIFALFVRLARPNLVPVWGFPRLRDPRSKTLQIWYQIGVALDKGAFDGYTGSLCVSFFSHASASLSE